MKRVTDFPKVYLWRAIADMRKQDIGLSVMVQEQMKLDPFERALFVFVNRRRDLMKIIYWDESGFAMWVKRLDQEKFFWPRKMPEDVIALTPDQMEWLLNGYNVWEMKGHKSLQFRSVS
jgi:transposase